jgi:HAD superfamily hydrolase (TIGR01509 family)
MTHKPKVLMFDLGGVIVPWVGLIELSKICGITTDEVNARFADSDVFAAYERGHVPDFIFLAELVDMFDLDLKDPRFKDPAALWNSWVHAPYPNTLETLAMLKTRYTTACLSNTNALHWAHLNTMFNTSETFHHDFASHHLNEAKPDAACYTKPLKIMGVEAKDVWFFDDTMANVEAARRVGITTHHVDRAVGVLPTLRELGLID